MSGKPRKPFSGIARPQMMGMDKIFGTKSSSDRRLADRVLDRRGVPEDYKTQYVAEKDLQGQAKKYLRTKNSNMKKQMKNKQTPRGR